MRARAIETMKWLGVIAVWALWLAVWAWAMPAFAQASQGGHSAGGGNINRGHFLKPEQYATQASMTLFVDPTGLDTNACTGTGTAACLTIQGARNKVPNLIQHPVTIDIAAGNYVGANFVGFSFNPLDPSNGAYILVRGALANFAPASGAATGTATSVSSGVSATQTCVTDSGQTWTVDDLRGRYLTLVGGTGAGQIFPIYTNTATQVCVVGAFSPLPVAGTTYAIQTPSAIVTTTVNQARLTGIGISTSSAAGTPYGFIVAGGGEVRTRSDVVDANIGFQDISVDAARGFAIYNAHVTFSRVRVSATSTAITVQAGGRLGATDSSWVTTSTTTNVLLGGSQGDLPINLNLARTFMRGGLAGILMATSVASASLSLGAVIDVTTASGYGIRLEQGSLANSQTPAQVLIRCLGSAANSATGYSYATALSNGGAPGYAQIEHFYIDDCATGVKLSGPGSSTFFRNTTLVNNTLGLNVTYGARILMGGGSVAFTTNTTDMSIDGVTSTYADFSALVPKSLVDLTTGSIIFMDTTL